MTLDYDPFDPAFRDDPYPTYRALRTEAPVYWAEKTGAWVLSRYDDVHFVLRNAELFSSDAMRTMLMGVPNPASMSPEDAQQMLELAKQMPFDVMQLLAARNLIAMDPPGHAAMRKIVNRGFTPRRIADLEERVREVVADAMAKLRGQDAFDLVADFAIPIPVVIIAEMLGVEPERLADFKRWSDSIIAQVSGSGRGSEPLAGAANTFREMYEYFGKLSELRRDDPRDDLITTLTHGEADEEPLSPLEVSMFAILLLVAGNETTTNLIGNTVTALLEHPDQLARVRADRSLVPSLVEEGLRFDSPIQLLFRRATQDVEISGTTIPANAPVAFLLGSANRDERRWDEPDRFDVGRDCSGHVAFGFGVHFCLGASLARLEARVALDAVLDELPSLERTSEGRSSVDSFLVRGPSTLPLSRVA